MASKFSDHLKYSIILSQTFYTWRHNKKVFLYSELVDHPIWKQPKLWETLIITFHF